ncbi:glyoxylase-like metal-dependent hydrolase (beta-lactamase superfamily II) [Sphingomonas vulcanisoli]|uniref:Glyoxylase-like metal-dependent hydrolase (Beta-lactamase superfamily II) n=1 Tax=Sphingomonas vulcanisoli TaxID=1658060 RepID=A0ABX0TMB8_9SPHN|nr:MBL fold metallo-hydrolase [Sphingomonas vulcanisoli]NIJ06661.1 glyoxylase-like metal-dependent hydrolase (beta-lactamase superfamily II) [Sphingomonas vulcanisoli]
MDQKPTYNPTLSGIPNSPSGAYPNGNPDVPYNLPGARNTDSAVPLHRSKPVDHVYVCDGPAPGKLAFRWMYGSNIAAKNRDPRIQVMQYNEDTVVLRQNMCVHWEAPFTYLLFGNKGALLIDTGANAERLYYPLRETVDAIIARWAKVRGRKTVPLTIALTSGEDIAQNQGLAQFAGRPDTTIVPKPLEVMKRFYGLSGRWPSGTGTIDLGDRIISVIPTPGTHKDGVSFYDPYCDLLFTGDFIFPGRINIGNDRDFVVSLERLKTFVAANNVKYILGGHIEMMFAPGKYYPRFYTYKPYERVLELEPSIIDELIQYGREVQGKEMVLIRPDFVLFNGVSPDQKTLVWPAGVPNITPPRPF